MAAALIVSVGLAAGVPPAATARGLARGVLLVASPELGDPNFARSVVLLLVYEERGGAMGVVVNRPTPLRLATVLPDVPALARRSDRLWQGGPVLPTALITLVRSRDDAEGSEAVCDGVRMLTSRDAVLRTLERRLAPDDLRAFAGHAGWAPGQLEAELARGDWTVVPATPEHVFSTAPERLWQTLERRGAGQWTERREPAAGGAARPPAA